MLRPDNDASTQKKSQALMRLQERIRSALSPAITRKLMPLDWPHHEDFFEMALAVKPELKVTISSLQALILLHWYLYTEVRRVFSSPFSG